MRSGVLSDVALAEISNYRLGRTESLRTGKPGWVQLNPDRTGGTTTRAASQCLPCAGLTRFWICAAGGSFAFGDMGCVDGAISRREAGMADPRSL